MRLCGPMGIQVSSDTRVFVFQFLFLFVWWLSEGPEGLHSFCFGVVREVKTIKHLSLLSSSPRSFNINGPAPKAPQFRHNLYIMTLCFCHSILLD